MPKKLILVYLALLLANGIWSVAGSIIKLTLNYIPPFTFLFLRFLIVCVALLPFALLETKKFKIDRRDYLNLFLLGIFSQSFIIFSFWSLKYTTVLDTAIISITAPIFSVAAGHYFYKERVDPRIKLGILIVVLGTIFIVLEPILENGIGLQNHLTRIWGNILALLYNFTFLVYTIWSKMSMGEKSPTLKKTLSFIHIKPMKRTYSPLLIVIISFYVGLATMAPFAILENTHTFGFENSANFNITTIPTVAIIGLLYMALFSSIVAYLLYQWGIEYISVSDTAILGYLGPVLAFPFAYLILGEVPTKLMLIGLSVIATGVLVAESNNNLRKHI